MSKTAARDEIAPLLEKALSLHKAKLIDEAAVVAEDILARRPGHVEALNFLAISRRAQGRLPEAADLYRQAIRHRPNEAALYSNLGNTLTDLKQKAEAEAAFNEALRLMPNFSDAEFSRARLLAESGRWEEAEAGYRKVLRAQPRRVEALNNLANTLREQGKVDEAIRCCQSAIEIEPTLPAAHYTLAHAHFLNGQLAAGGPHYEYRSDVENFGGRNGSYPRTPFWVKGDSIKGRRVLLMHDQGLGDTLMFMRFAYLVKEAGAAEVVLEVQPPLRWLKSLLPGLTVIASGDKLPPVDVKALLLSLPYLLDITYANMPAWTSYLRPPAHYVEWGERLSGKPGLKVGLFWQGNPKAPLDKGRSFPLKELAPLAAVKGVRFISLQNFAGMEQLDELPPGFEVERLPGYSADDSLGLYDTAGVIPHLDLVITSDTGAAHLAGAMGKGAWVLLRKVPEWRWLLERRDTPWYSCHRLYRQEKDGDWQIPIRAMVPDLERLIKG